MPNPNKRRTPTPTPTSTPSPTPSPVPTSTPTPTKTVVAAQTITIDPATRLEGHLKVKLTSDGTKVTKAESSGMMFRGFENLLLGKNPGDAVHITQRVCGVCPISHAMASSLAIEAAAGFAAPTNARIIRNLILGSNYIQSHILHFYHLALPSYLKLEGSALGIPPWTPAYNTDLRFDSATNQTLVQHYLDALTARRQAHEMAAIFGGKLPHTAAFEYGGVTSVPNSTLVSRFQNYLGLLLSFIDDTYLPDVNTLASKYNDCFSIGRGYGNLLAYGVFDLDSTGNSKLLKRGRVANGSTTVQTVDLGAIVEQTKYSWYADAASNPSTGTTTPSASKSGAYSWLKAPRYGGAPYETGPLARMWVNGDYRRGISVMDRHLARANEAKKVAMAMQDWVKQLSSSQPVFSAHAVPSSGTGIGLTEAPRGALGHWLRVQNGTIASYQILTPTCWNCSPRDDSGVGGPLEHALEGTPVRNSVEPIEALRVVQSYDPCLSCAVH